MITFPDKPIPVIVENDKEGYVLYIESSGMLENDIWTVVLCEGGHVRHYNTSQLRVHQNLTFGIKKTPQANVGPE